MPLIENQQIGVWMNHCEPIGPCLIDAAYLALKLEKNLCLLATYTSEKEKLHHENKARLYAETMQRDLPSISISMILRKGKLHEHIRWLGDEENFVLLCFNKKITRGILKAFYLSGFPFFISKNKEGHQKLFKKILIPIDFRINTKTATLWGSYLGRFNQSDVLLYTANDKNDEDLKAKVQDNIAFVKKFYGQFFFNFYFEMGKSNSWMIHHDALTLQENHDLYIFTGSLNVSPVDWLIGPFEMRIVNKASLPVLMINPQKELYVLCD